MVFVAGCQTPQAFEPGERSFDFIAVFVEALIWLVQSLSRVVLPLAEGTDQSQAFVPESFSQSFRVSSFVIQKPLRFELVTLSFLQDWFDEFGFVRRGTFDMHGDWNPVGLSDQHDLAAFANLGVANFQAPFLAGQKVPSPINVERSIWPSRSNRSSRIAQALRNEPLRVHLRKRRQQVEPEEYSSGTSCQRAPVIKTHNTPSKQTRLSTSSRPPSGERGLLGEQMGNQKPLVIRETKKRFHPGSGGRSLRFAAGSL